MASQDPAYGLAKRLLGVDAGFATLGDEGQEPVAQIVRRGLDKLDHRWLGGRA